MCGCSGKMTIQLFCNSVWMQGPSRKEPSLYRQVDIQGTVWVWSQCNAIWHMGKKHGMEHSQPESTTVLITIAYVVCILCKLMNFIL